MQWIIKSFKQLSLDQLYDMIKLRVDVFVVEQCCYYPELDNKDRDPAAFHLLGYRDGELLAYLRGLPVGCSYPDYPSLGRILTAQQARNTGLGHQLLKNGIEECEQRWPGLAIKISAQEHLQGYYQQYGFNRVSDTYLEDNIPHVSMLRNPV